MHKEIAIKCKAPVTPNGDATEFVQRSKTMSTVGSPRNTPKTIKFVSYSVYTTSSQRPYIAHTTFPQRFYSVRDASTACKQLLQRVYGAHTARPQRSHGAHSVFTAIIAFKLFNLIFYYFEKPYFANTVIYFYFSKQFVLEFNSCLNV